MPVYLKYGNINGEMKGKYKGWIELQSCQFGLGRGITTPVGTSSQREASAPSLSEVVVTKTMDSTSPLLHQEGMIGKAVKAIVEFTMSDKLQTVYLHIEMEDAMVSGYSVSSGGDRPSDLISINFRTINFKSTVATTPPATVNSP
jgi:type VI secretion system secreted protein Hcp